MKNTNDEQLSTNQLSNRYTKASGMKENNDSSQGLRKTKIWVRESVTRGEGISIPQRPS